MNAALRLFTGVGVNATHITTQQISWGTCLGRMLLLGSLHIFTLNLLSQSAT